MARRAGVIGWPVSHSLSPRLHGYWLKHYRIDGDYSAVEAPPAALADKVKELAGKHWRGFNVTVPHKEKIISLLDSIDGEAKKIGAINTVIVEEGKLLGRNTDAYGFAENIRPHLPGDKGKAVVLGAGGAARAVIHALATLGFARIVIANRTVEKAVELAKLAAEAEPAPWEKRAALLEGAALLVNATSLGLAGQPPLDLDLSALPGTALVTDIVYKPLLTPLLMQAQARGNPVVDGLGMLMHQAVPGFEAWFGVRPEVTPELKRHLLEG